jgi:hypothetical protein
LQKELKRHSFFLGRELFEDLEAKSFVTLTFRFELGLSGKKELSKVFCHQIEQSAKTFNIKGAEVVADTTISEHVVVLF